MKYATYDANTTSASQKIVSTHKSHVLAEKAAKRLGGRHGVATVSDDARKGGFVRNFQI